MQKGLVLVLIKGAVFTEGVRLYFEEWGFEVRDISGAQPSLQDVITQQPALIVLDLPARLAASGAESQLLDQNHQVLLLLLATDARLLQRHALHLQRVYHYDCIPKPCPVEELERAAERLLGCTLSMPAGTQAVREVTVLPAGWA
jgi:DNA-binding response OmpR family regulator